MCSNIIKLVDSSMLVGVDKELTKRFFSWIEASQAYYDGDEPIMSDAEFDELEESLRNCDCEYIKKFIESQVYKVSGFEFVPNIEDTEMISLFKIKGKQDTLTFTEVNKFLSKTNSKQIYFAPKFDGASLKIEWLLDCNGKAKSIKQIKTRGGIDVTDRFSSNKDIQETARFNARIITGELLIKKDLFLEHFSDEYENPRNFVGSLFKRTSLDKYIIDKLSFVACTDGKNPLITEPCWKPTTGIRPDLFYQAYLNFKSDKFPYLCDGIVFAKIETGPRQVKDNYPLNMVAVKYPSERATTVVIGFDWTQKKSGKLTPRVMVQPVRLDGSTISYTNGYNIERLIENKIGIGAIVEITKSGDIIPVIVKTIKSSTNIEYPKIPHTRVGKHLIASDLEETKQFKFISAFKQLEIAGIGDIQARKIGELVDFDIISLFNPATRFKLLSLGSGAIQQKINQIYEIKGLYLNQVINLLQFDSVGTKLSSKIALLLTKQSNDTQNIPSHVFTNVLKGEGFLKINESIKRLTEYGIKVLKPIMVSEDQFTYEMSGSPIGMTKKQFEGLVKAKYPNAQHTTLTKDTKVLFVDSLKSNSSKVLKARKYNIQIKLYSEL